MKSQDIRTNKFDNGLTLLSQVITWINSVSICVAVKAGPRYESEESSGLAHFLEHMLFEGTKSYPSAKELAQVIESVGGKSSAWTDKEYVAYNIKVPKEHLDKGLSYLHEILFNPAFDDESVAREKTIILEEMQRKEDNPEVETVDLFMEYCWGKEQALGRSTLGERSTIENITPKRLKDYLKDFYYSSNMTISVVGNFKERELKRAIQKYFGHASIKKRVEMEKNTFFYPKLRTKKIKADTKQSQLILGTVTNIHYHHKDRFVMRVIADILSFGVSSRLFNKLVYQLGISYSPGVFNWTFKDTGMLIIYGGFSPNNIKLAIDVIKDELQKLREENVNSKELSTAKIIDIANMYYSFETPDSISWWYATMWATERRILSVGEIKREIEKVTPQDIKRIANKYLNEKNFITLIRGELQ